MRKLLFFLVFFSAQGISAQTVNSASIYENKVKFLMTRIDLKALKAGKDYVGLIMFINVSKRPLKIKEINNECSCFSASPDKRTIMPGEKGVITYTFKRPQKGAINKKSFIFFNEIKSPVPIVISGNFI